MSKRVYESDNIAAAAAKMRELAGTETQYTTYDFVDGVEEVYKAGTAVSYDVGYQDGYVAGQTAGGVYDTEINNLLAVAPFLRKPIQYIDEDYVIHGYSGFLVGKDEGIYNYAIVLPWVTELGENSTDDFWYCEAFIFTSTIPPIINPQGLWESWGGNNPPEKIFVPDASIDAYKSETNLAEFADRIYPLSQYNGEGSYGGLYNG